MRCEKQSKRFRLSLIAGLTAGLLIVCMAAPVRAADIEPLVKVTFAEEPGRNLTVEGKVVVEAADGGILLLGRDGRLWTVPPRKQISREKTTQAFSRLTADELSRALTDELGAGFEIVRTKHYVIATSTGPHYAQWCGDLFERLLEGFLTYWKSKGCELVEPTWPLPAIVFADERDFKAHAMGDAGEFAESSKGYYSVRTNRIVLYDLTAGNGKAKATSVREVKRRAAAAAFNMATIVHEATHQIAFNSGMHTRYADNPLWLTEGMAMFFETPDLDSADGWKTIGQVNRLRYDRFLDFLRKRRKRDSLVTLITQKDRFIDSKKAADAYAEAWALTYFLIEKRPRQYVDYLKRIARKGPLVWDAPASRAEEFQSVFAGDFKSMDGEFVRFMKSLPKR